MRPNPDTCRDPELLAAEVRRLRAVIDSGECPHVTGTVTQYCTLTPFTLTDAEREVVETAALEAEAHQQVERAATLRGLLERAENRIT